MVFPNGIWFAVGISALLCCIGFYHFVWFMSVGYGLATAGIGVVLLVLSLVRGTGSLLFTVQCVLMAVYGIRLGGFLLVRELTNINYKKKISEIGVDAKVPFFVAIFMWVYCSFMYVAQSAGPVYRCLNGLSGTSSVMVVIGVIISAVGILMEAVADKQKSAAKNIDPNLPAMNGLFKVCRCPNYFGEMLFWTGTFLSGIGSYTGAQWIVALIGYAEIIIVMVSGAKRVETRHIKHYGSLPEYNKYADTTPLLIPFVPLYHMTSPEKIAAEEAARQAKKKK